MQRTRALFAGLETKYKWSKIHPENAYKYWHRHEMHEFFTPNFTTFVVGSSLLLVYFGFEHATYKSAVRLTSENCLLEQADYSTKSLQGEIESVKRKDDADAFVNAVKEKGNFGDAHTKVWATFTEPRSKIFSSCN